MIGFDGGPRGFPAHDLHGQDARATTSFHRHVTGSWFQIEAFL